MQKKSTRETLKAMFAHKQCNF